MFWLLAGMLDQVEEATDTVLCVAQRLFHSHCQCYCLWSPSGVASQNTTDYVTSGFPVWFKGQSEGLRLWGPGFKSPITMGTHWGSGIGKALLKYLTYIESPIRVALCWFQLYSTKHIERDMKDRKLRKLTVKNKFI